MTIGDQIFVALPLPVTEDPKGVVYEGTVIALGDRGEVIVKNDHGVHTYGGPFSNSRCFADARSAWSHNAETLRRYATRLLDAVAVCEANL
jgi:hypothetical protein